MEMQTEEDQNIIREYEHYQGQAEAYGKNIELINSNLTELGSVEVSLDQLKDTNSTGAHWRRVFCESQDRGQQKRHCRHRDGHCG